MDMRLLVVTPFLETHGGMERVVLKIASHFDARIHCLRYNPEGTFEEFRGLDIEVARPGFLSRLPVGRRVSSAIEAGSHFYNVRLKDYDLVNAHQTPSEWIRNRNSPVVWYCHSPNREAFDLYDWRMSQRGPLQKAAFWPSIEAFRIIEARTVPKIEYIFTNSKNTQGRISHYLHRESEVLHPGVELERFSCSDYGKFFLYPSRIVPEKRIEFALDAFDRFSKSNPDSGWKLVVAGSVSDRPEHRKYFACLKGMGVANVEFRSNISEEELLGLYSRCGAILYTPINEDFGIVPLEAFASSKPCIAVNEGGPKETVEDGVDGFLVNSTDEMAQRMAQLAERPELLEEMGRRGRKKAETKFTWKRFLDRFGEKAEELIKEKGK